MKSISPQSHICAFTLLEMLAAMAIMLVLAAMLVGAIGQTRNSGDRAAVVSAMRQIGMAIYAYAADNGGALPGPLWNGQGPWYRKSDDSMISTRLWPYLALPEPEFFTQENKILSFPPYVRQRRGGGSPSVILNSWVKTTGGTWTRPWGHNGWNDPKLYQTPVKAAAIAKPSATSMMEDVDLTNAHGAGWSPNCPPKPILGNVRCRLFFDGSARLVPIP